MKTRFLFVIFLLIISNPVLAQVPVNINAPNSVTVGSTFTAQVVVGDVVDLDVAHFMFEFDPNILQLVDVNAGSLMSSAGLTKNTNTLGKVIVMLNMPGFQGASGAGAITDIELQALKEISCSDLKLSAVTLGDTSAQPIPAVVVQTARVCVIGESPGIVAANITPPDTITAGDNFVANINISDVSDLDTANFTLAFAPTVIQLVAVGKGSLMADAKLTFNANTPGKVEVALNMPDLNSVSGLGTIADIEFQAVGLPGSSCDLKLLSISLGNTDAQAIPVSAGEPEPVELIGPGAVSVSMSCPNAVRTGDSFTAYVKVAQVANMDTASFTLAFDEAVLQVKDVTHGSLTPTANVTFNSNVPGKVDAAVNMPAVSGVSGVGTIAAIELQAIGDVGTASDLALSDVSLGDATARAIPVQLVQTSATVNVIADAPPQVTVSVNAPNRVAVNQTFTAYVEITQVTDLDVAQFTLTFAEEVLQLKSVSPTELMVGADLFLNDQNPGKAIVFLNMPSYDNGVTGAGAIAAIEFEAIGDECTSSLLALSGVYLGDIYLADIPFVVGDDVTVVVSALGDVTGDGTISALDAAWVLQAVVGLITLDETQRENADVDGDGNVTPYDASLILQIVVGLINEFPTSPQPSPDSGSSLSYEVSLPNLTASAGDRIRVPIYIGDATGLNAGSLTLRYNPTALRVVEVKPSSSDYYCEFNAKRAGGVRVAFAGAQPTTGRGEVIYVTFETLSGAEGTTSPLILDTVDFADSLNITKINGSVVILPQKFMLLQNYPNPFNPETWLPYQLANDALVDIRIYNANGQLVRRLDLGEQQAGNYIAQGKAAHWDGRDNLGQSVASGVYFYTLNCRFASPLRSEQAGDFKATRRMIIVK